MNNQIKSERIWRWKDLPQHFGLSKSSIRREIIDGRFPAPEKLNHYCVGWRDSVIAQTQIDRRAMFNAA